MISKTIGYNGVHNIFRQTQIILFQKYRKLPIVYRVFHVWQAAFLSATTFSMLDPATHANPLEARAIKPWSVAALSDSTSRYK